MTRLTLSPHDGILMSQQLSSADDSLSEIVILDHLGGFNKALRNEKLDQINDFAKAKNKKLFVYVSYVFDDEVTQNYPNLVFKLQLFPGLSQFVEYNMHPDLSYKNFLCSFNGTPHVSRKLLVCALKKFGYFDSQYCSKNFVLSAEVIDGHLNDFVPDRTNFYNKFFAINGYEDFLNALYSFGHVQYDHKNNIYNLETKITESFIHLASESFATSYVPFFTEKFLYSVVTRGLFLSYAQPGWHEHLEKYYGFKKYKSIFDYRFDQVQNPIERLIELLTMISKFKNLSFAELHDLYQLEIDTIEYNYDHYFSGDYQKQLAKFS